MNPSDLAREQEENLIGALLKDPERLNIVGELVKPDDFANHALGWAYGTMLALRARGLHVDSVTVGDELERHNRMGNFVIGGKAGRLALIDLRTNFRGDNPESYAVKVADYSAKRQMLQEFNAGASWALNGREASEIRDDMIRRLTNIQVPNAKVDQHTQTFKQALSQNYDEVNNGNIDFVPTGFVDLDRALNGGLYAPDFMIVAGRPGQGKTAWVLSVAMNAARSGKRVVVFSLEMSNGQVVMRCISMETGIPFGAMRSRSMNAEQKDKYNRAIEELESLPIHLNDMPAITPNQMRYKLRQIIALHGRVDLVIVDYLQLQGADNKDHGTREQEVSEVSRGLKAIAKEFSVPVLSAAQLSRAIEQRKDRKPQLSDLRESGSLEQDADIVAFIHPDEHKPGNVEFIIAKQRNGAVGSIPLTFRKAMTKFESSYQPKY